MEQIAKNGSLQDLVTAAKNGDDLDDPMFDAALEAALETGNRLVLPGVYGAWNATKTVAKNKKSE